MESLIGRKAVITVVEPVTFAREAGATKLTGEIVSLDGKRALVSLERPVALKGASYVTAYCQIRHEERSAEDLASGDELSFNVTLVPKASRSLDEIERSDFREGYATVALVTLLA